MRKTKIIATVGPASNDVDLLVKMIHAGMNVVRLNASHGNHASHAEMLSKVRKASEITGKPIAVMLDLCGPKIRVGKLENGRIELADGEDLVIRSGDFVGNREAIGSTYPRLVDDLEEGGRVLMNDGLIELIVREKKDDQVVCKVIHGGTLKQSKGINLPGAKISSPSVTEKDVKDIHWGVENNVDYIALSFVRHSDDVKAVRRILHKADANIQVIAKIEKPEALEDVDEIIDSSDGIIVARGDLGVEMNPDELPPIQKELIRKANEKDKPGIIATQMLESMTEHPRPTRAEVSDVANAIFDGSDALLLSGETAVGKYPINAILMMDKVVKSAEEYMESRPEVIHSHISRIFGTEDAVCHGAAIAAHDVGARLIAVFSKSGTTTLLISKYRAKVPVVGVTHWEATARRMCLYRGVIPLLTRQYDTIEASQKDLEEQLLEKKLADHGDTFVIVMGTRLGKSGGTNSIKVHRIETPLVTRSFRKDKAGTVTAEGPGFEILFKEDLCFDCGVCVGRCPVEVFELVDNRVKLHIERARACLLDMTCVENCPVNAIKIVVK